MIPFLEALLTKGEIQMQYRNIVFIQGSEAVPYIETLNENGSHRAMEELFSFDFGEGEITDYEPWGDADDLYEWTNSDGQKFVLSCNHDIDYISLTEVIE